MSNSLTERVMNAMNFMRELTMMVEEFETTASKYGYTNGDTEIVLRNGYGWLALDVIDDDDHALTCHEGFTMGTDNLVPFSSEGFEVYETSEHKEKFGE